ncbi:hypothetical protein [Kitasatospora sp. NPDC002040]|uniref:hypothetical protein n=1 Tax=Kitasatospora sp. NPDC002040 TaxID=3154661 RepID=UPI00331AFE62
MSDTTPTPDALAAPTVPAGDDGLIDLDDANAGVEITIPAYTNHKPSDQIPVTWNDATNQRANTTTDKA